MGKEGINDIKNQWVKKAQGMSNPLPKRLYTLKEASIYLGRTLWGLREMVWAGRIPVVKDGKKLFIDIHDLERYISSHKTTYV
jgi:excisionase family DNA binding protein